jgi:hypothetical protein
LGIENTYFALDYQIMGQDSGRVSLRLHVPLQGSEEVRECPHHNPATIFVEDVDGWLKKRSQIYQEREWLVEV